MFCRNCGNQLRDGANFCRKCGAPVKSPAESAKIPESPVIKSEESAKISDLPVKKVEESTKTSDSPVKKENITNKYLIPILVVVILIVIALTAMFFATSEKRKLKSNLDLGRKYLQELNYEEALTCFDKALEIDPLNSDAYIGKATAYVGKGDLDKAKDVILDGLNIITNEADKNGASEEIMNSIAILNKKSEEIEESINSIEESERKSDSDDDATYIVEDFEGSQINDFALGSDNNDDPGAPLVDKDILKTAFSNIVEAENLHDNPDPEYPTEYKFYAVKLAVNDKYTMPVLIARNDYQVDYDDSYYCINKSGEYSKQGGGIARSSLYLSQNEKYLLLEGYSGAADHDLTIFGINENTGNLEQLVHFCITEWDGLELYTYDSNYNQVFRSKEEVQSWIDDLGIGNEFAENYYITNGIPVFDHENSPAIELNSPTDIIDTLYKE